MKYDTTRAGDLSFDEHGSWGNPSGRKNYFDVDDRAGVCKVGGRDKKPKSGTWNFCIKRNVYRHPVDVDRFRKTTYRGVLLDNSPMSFDVVQYECSCGPMKFGPSKPHGNNQFSTSPFKRVKPSTRSLMDKQSSFLAPKQNLIETRKKVGGTSAAPSELPRNSKQAHNIAMKNPDSKRSSGAGKPATNSFTEVLDMMGVPGSFVKFHRVSSAQDDSETQQVDIFLADPRAIAMLKEYGLKSSKVRIQCPVRFYTVYCTSCLVGFEN